MPPKKHIIIIGVLCVIALGLGYWVGMPPPSPPPPEFLKQGLVAYYPFNGNAKDESGNGNDGEVKGPISAEDRFGLQSSSYKFSKITDVIDIPNIPLNRLTVSLWHKYNGAGGGYNTLLCHDETPNGRHHLIVDAYTGKIGCFYSNFNDSGYKFSADEIYFIVLVKDVKNCTIFINGLQVSCHGDCFENKAWPLSRIGDCGTQGGQAALGIIDDVRIYNRALSEAEVKELYEFEKPKTQQASTATPPTVVTPTSVKPKPTPAKPQPTPTRQLTPEEKKVVGTYERKEARGTTGFVFLDNGLVELYKNSKKDIREIKWSIVGKEFHILYGVSRNIYRINPDNSITQIAFIDGGKRQDYPEGRQMRTFKKIK